MARSFDLVLMGGTCVTPMGVVATDIGVKGQHVAAIGTDVSGRYVQ